MNKIILHGNVTSDPTIRVRDGKKVATFGFAVNRNKQDTDFFNCVVFDNQADIVDKYVAKGRELMIDGSCQNNFYKTRDGFTQYSMSIIVNRIEFCGKKTDDDQATDNYR